ncbi:MAG TPA: FecR domain-containing protein [Sedimentisphaerales bacterium]|nr:FecR domain-containing protein [Sedimentisphaerales bacterium]HRS12186.1 FecR domain-containing protein [Sedimentisphaerales bacterium]HRV49899.1 FecR domain-containing protein [Sedimentisphaerales bacterium]
MIDRPTEHSQFFELLGALREGALTNEQFAQLDRFLADDPAVRQLYVEYMLLCAELRHYHGMSETADLAILPGGPADVPPSSLQVAAATETQGIPTILDELLERDRAVAARRAAEEARQRADAHREAIRRAADDALERFKEQERHRREELAYREYLARRRQLAVSVFAVGVLLVSGVLVWVSRLPVRTTFSPVPATPAVPPVVATITRSSNAVWDRTDVSTAQGTALRASSLFLMQGLIQMVFEGGSEVLVQAPAVLRLESADQVFLHSGAVSVSIGEDSTGFIVRTPTGTVVDYGTEFGVIVRQTGETEALVYQGKVGIRSGSDPVRSVASTILVEGQAGAVDAAGNVVSRRYLPGQIVREMPQEPAFGVPGRRLDLADVIGAGNGFGTGAATSAISPVTGRYVMPVESDRHGTHQYVVVPWNRYVDGVFVPDGTRSQIVSSVGHTFADCPITNNIYYLDITNVGDAGVGRQMLSGQAYGSPDRPCILMHANLGITFDLAEIASLNPGLRIERFCSAYGVSESATNRPCNADFWVLVDGRVRFSRTGVKVKGIAGQIDVELADTDRFLTLITTDGGDADFPAGLRATDSDWCVFVEPNLELAPPAVSDL